MSLEKPTAVEERAHRPMAPLGGGADPTPNPLLLLSSSGHENHDLNTPTMTPNRMTWLGSPSAAEPGSPLTTTTPAHSGLDPEPALFHAIKEQQHFDSSSSTSNDAPMEVIFSQDIPVVFEEDAPASAMDLLWDLQDPAAEPALIATVAAGTISTGAVQLEAAVADPQPFIVTLPNPESEAFATNPMACFNPLDVEGKFAEHLMVQQEVVSAPPPAKRNKKDLKLIMPEVQAATTPAQPEASSLIDTPAIESVLGKQAEEADFDLLAFVTNQTLPVNDPSFLALIEDVSAPSVSEPAPLSTIDETVLGRPSTSKAPPKGKRIMVKKEAEEETPVEKAPSKPKYVPFRVLFYGEITISSFAVIHSFTSFPVSRRRGRPPTATSTLTASSLQDHSSYATTGRKSKAQAAASSVVSEDEVEDKKYRRMRDLNNAASKRCRQNRKRKFDSLLGSEEQLTARNKELKIKCKHMEGLVRQLKAKFIEKVANPKRQPLDLDQLMAQRLSAM